MAKINDFFYKDTLSQQKNKKNHKKILKNLKNGKNHLKTYINLFHYL